MLGLSLQQRTTLSCVDNRASHWNWEARTTATRSPCATARSSLVLASLMACRVPKTIQHSGEVVVINNEPDWHPILGTQFEEAGQIQVVVYSTVEGAPYAFHAYAWPE